MPGKRTIEIDPSMCLLCIFPLINGCCAQMRHPTWFGLPFNQVTGFRAVWSSVGSCRLVKEEVRRQITTDMPKDARATSRQLPRYLTYLTTTSIYSTTRRSCMLKAPRGTTLGATKQAATFASNGWGVTRPGWGASCCDLLNAQVLAQPEPFR